MADKGFPIQIFTSNRQLLYPSGYFLWNRMHEKECHPLKSALFGYFSSCSFTWGGIEPLIKVYDYDVYLREGGAGGD